MNTSTLKELKAELSTLHPTQLVDLCIRLAKYKKENKELLSYLLFSAHDEQLYITQVKKLVDEDFESINRTSMYLAKKTVRKALRNVNKYIKYSGLKQTEVELLIHFCSKLRRAGVPLHANTVLGNIYLRQYLRLKKILATLHEDLQADYADEVGRL